MKSNLFFILLIVFITCSCSKNAGRTVDPYENSPATTIPAELKNSLWFWGGLGPVSYYDRDGHEVGNETEAAREYEFKEVNGKGRIEFIQYLGLRNASNCVTEIYTTKKGTIVFEGSDRFTFYPVEGSFKTIKKGCSKDETTIRAATGDELKPEAYLWEIKEFSGEKLLYVYDTTDLLKQNPVFVYQQAW
ncbi:MAG: hypothetical protein ACTHJ5_08275 [Ilyomonas sp.]